MTDHPRNHRRGFHATLGNMPFLGGSRIATELGDQYASWLKDVYDGSGHTDYVGYFFLRAAKVTEQDASVGFIATDSIADGETRRTTLARLLRTDQPMEIHHAVTGVPWPGRANVLISTVQLARGNAAASVRGKRLDGRLVASINSRLLAGVERDDPLPLPSNDGCAFVGCFLRGDGFVLDLEEAEALIAKRPADRAVVRPYLVGDDLNNRPDQSPSRCVIDFWDKTLDEARAWRAPFAIIDERVRPQRERLKTTRADADHRKHWWRFANTRKDLRDAMKPLSRVIATARVSKHLVFSFTSTANVPSEQVVIFPSNSYSMFGVLQSSVHAAWVRLLAGARGEGVRYSPTECFASFPFPAPEPRTAFGPVEEAARVLDEARTRYALQEGLGLTDVYNSLYDSKQNDKRVEELRRQHDALDRAVVSAYGWRDLAVHSRFADGPERRVFEEEVVDRLFLLNAERAVAAAPLASPGPRQAGRAGPALKQAEPKRSGETARTRRVAR